MLSSSIILAPDPEIGNCRDFFEFYESIVIFKNNFSARSRDRQLLGFI